MNLFTIGRTYKIEDLRGIYWTAIILYEDENLIKFLDIHGNETGLNKLTIKRWKPVMPNEA